jgi:hypothetical protein
MAATAASATRSGPPHTNATSYTSSSLSDVTAAPAFVPAFQRQPQINSTPGVRSRLTTRIAVKGLVAGRSLLYPADDDVAAEVDTAVSLL